MFRYVEFNEKYGRVVLIYPPLITFPKWMKFETSNSIIVLEHRKETIMMSCDANCIAQPIRSDKSNN